MVSVSKWVLPVFKENKSIDHRHKKAQVSEKKEGKAGGGAPMKEDINPKFNI